MKSALSLNIFKTEVPLNLARHLACAAALILVLPGCRAHSKSHNVNGSTASVLRYPIPIEPQSLDPAKTDSGETNELLANIYEAPVILGPDNLIDPGLAEKWDISKDGKTYTFHLHPKARFHKPYARSVTSEDVKYSLERALLPDTRSPYATTTFEDIEGAKEVIGGKQRELSGFRVIDPQTFSITLTRPRSYFLGAMRYCFVVCRESIERNHGRIDEHAAIGTGPFRLTEYRHGSRVALEANAEYYRGAPKLARIERPIVHDMHTAHAMYEAGDIDMCLASTPDIARDLKDPKFRDQAKAFAQASTWHLGFQEEQQPIFRDRRVRRAIAMCIDRDEDARIAFGGIRARADSFLPPMLAAHNPAAKSPPYSPSAARALFAEAGYAGGRGFPNLTLTIGEGAPGNASEAQIIRSKLKTILGIEVAIREQETATFEADLIHGKLPMWLIGQGGSFEPRDYLSVFFRTGGRYNYHGYSNPKFDSLADSADAEMDGKKRIVLYRAAEQIILEDVPVIPLSYPVNGILMKPYVRDLQVNGNDIMPHYHTRIGR